MKVILILADVLLIAGLAGAIYIVFYTEQLHKTLPQTTQTGITIMQPAARTSGLGDMDVNKISSLLGGKRTSAIQPVKNGPDGAAVLATVDLDKFEVRAVALDTEEPAMTMCTIRDTESGDQINLFVGDEYKGWKFIRAKGQVAIFSSDGKEKEMLLCTVQIASANAPQNPNGMPNQPNGIPNQPGVNPNQPNQPRVPNGGANPNQPGNRPGIRQPTSVRREIRREYIRELAGKADKLMNDVYVSPFVSNGKSIGMKINSIAPNSPLNAFGFQPGDIVKSWNGTPITNEKQLFDIYNKYKNNVDTVPGTNEVIIIRQGQEIRLNINLR